MVSKSQLNKGLRFKKNGNFIQVFDKNDYLGNLSYKELCQVLIIKRAVGTTEFLAQLSFIKSRVSFIKEK